MQHAADHETTTGDTTKDAPRRKAYPAFSLRLQLLAGLIPAVLVYALFLFTTDLDREERIRQEALNSLSDVSSVLNATWERTTNLSGTLSRQLNGASRSGVQAIVAPYKMSWPNAVFSLYDRQGNLLVPDGSDAAPVPYTVRNLVQKALYGQPASGFTGVRGFLSPSVAWPVKSGDVGVLVMSLPLDTLALNEIKEYVRADIALLPFKDFNSDEFSALSDAASTFSSSNREAADVANALAPILNGKNLSGPVFFDFGRDGALAVAAPLTAPNGDLAGAIVAAPLRSVPEPSPLLPLAAALGAGLVGFTFTALGLRKRGARLDALLAQELEDFTEEQRGGKSAGWKETGWPEPLAGSLSKLSALIRERETKKDTRDASGRTAQPPGRVAGSDTRGNEHFLRLFDNVPVGVFQANRSGYFLRVNSAFARLLGYNSPEQLLARSSSFSDFFLYTGGLLNPLADMAEEPGINHIVSLRRQDGKVWRFTLRLSYLPSFNGEYIDIIEGFLTDRQAEENALQAERDKDYARKQRASLALLLAATCRQTQNYLRPSGSNAVLRASDLPLPEQSADTDAESFDGPPERRSSVISVNSVLSDIYQIAMTEAESSPPLFMPIEFDRFFRSLSQQVRVGMHSRGISLHFELARELPERLSGPAPLLRHALERALLTVTAATQGGWAGVSLIRDPNTPGSHGVTRVLFSVTWSRLHQEAADAQIDRGAQNTVEALGSTYRTLLELPADPAAATQPAPEDNGTLSIAEEQEVIRYLVEQMQGDLLESVFTSELHSLRMVIPLPWTPESIPADGVPMPAPQSPVREDAALSVSGQHPEIATMVEEELTFNSGLDDELAVPVMPHASSLELLAMNNPESPAVYAEEDESAPDEGLDILLVDGNLNNRLLFSLFLRNTRHRITEAHDAQQGVEAFQHGVEAFQHGHFDLIFLDMEMPLMDGYQATRIIRALETDSGRKATPIVAMTTYALPEFRRQCLLVGCSAFLSKPFSKNALLSMLEAFAQFKKDERVDNFHTYSI